MNKEYYKMYIRTIQSTIIISASLILNNRLSRNENLVPVLTLRSTNMQKKILWKRENCPFGAISPLFHNIFHIQYNLSGSNTDSSFTVDVSNSFFSPYKILPIAQENKYLMIFSYFIMELYVVCTHYRYFLSELVPWLTQWFELPMSRMNFHGPKDVRAIDVRLYL